MQHLNLAAEPRVRLPDSCGASYLIRVMSSPSIHLWEVLLSRMDPNSGSHLH